MQDLYKDIGKYNLVKKHKVLVVFDDMIADIINSKKLNPVVTELFFRDIKLSISLVLLHNHTLKY